MKTAERERLYKEIKEYANEEFGIELKDEDLNEYKTEYLIEIYEKIKEIITCGDVGWLLSYMECSCHDFLESIFRYEEKSVFYDKEEYNFGWIVLDSLYGMIDESVEDKILECLDCKKYAEDYLGVEKTEYGYVVAW